MLFASLEFILFLPIVFCLCWFVFQKNLNAQNLLGLLSSYVFNSKVEMSERTGKILLKEVSKTQMVDKIVHGVYERKIKLIEEDEID